MFGKLGDQNHYGPNMWAPIQSASVMGMTPGETVVGHNGPRRLRTDGTVHLHSQINQLLGAQP